MGFPTPTYENTSFGGRVRYSSLYDTRCSAAPLPSALDSPFPVVDLIAPLRDSLSTSPLLESLCCSNIIILLAVCTNLPFGYKEKIRYRSLHSATTLNQKNNRARRNRNNSISKNPTLRWLRNT